MGTGTTTAAAALSMMSWDEHSRGLPRESAGIKTVINLADSQAELEQFSCGGLHSPYYKNLYENGRHPAEHGRRLPLPEFKEKLKAGLEFLTPDGPYFIHCNEGKTELDSFPLWKPW